jgi:hypothetical protein
MSVPSTSTNHFPWLDVFAPRVIQRPLSLLSSDADPASLHAVRLEQLLPHVLYVVPRDAYPDQLAHNGLVPGAILSRHAKYTRRYNRGQDWPRYPGNHCFVSFHDIFGARRTLAKVDRHGTEVELPDLRQWRGGLDELLRMSWRLEASDVEGQEAFALRAVGLLEGHTQLRDPDKRSAARRTARASSPTDSLGRFNPARIPLITMGADNSLARRVQAVRGIGRHMGLRELVLEVYLDQLRDICVQVRISQEYRLNGSWLAQTAERTGSKVRAEADRLDGAANRLLLVTVKPFRWYFARCAADLRDAATMLRGAADERSDAKIQLAKDLIGRVYRSMILLDVRWRLEELLLRVDIYRDSGDRPGRRRLREWKRELSEVRGLLINPDRITGLTLDADFRGLKTATAMAEPVYGVLAQLPQDPEEIDLHSLRSALREACDPPR